MEKTESREQQLVVIHMWNKHPETRKLLFAIPNGGLRNKLEAKRLKAEGLTPGVSDLLFMWKSKTYCIEMKLEKGGVQSKVQKEWQCIVESQGFKYYLCHGAQQAIDVLEGILNDEKSTILSL